VNTYIGYLSGVCRMGGNATHSPPMRRCSFLRAAQSEAGPVRAVQRPALAFGAAARTPAWRAGHSTC